MANGSVIRDLPARSSNRKLRIALVTDSRDPSGVGEHMLTLGRRLGAEFDVVLAYPEGIAKRSFLARAARASLGVKALNCDEGHVSDWLRRSEVDILHVHAGIGWEGHGLARAGRAAGVFVVRTEHLPYLITDADQEKSYRGIVELTDHVIAVSESSAHSFAPQGWDDGKVTIIRNGIEPPSPKRDRERVRAELGLASGETALLTVARLSAQKGQAILVVAMTEVAKRYPQSRLFVAGSGDDRWFLEQLTARLCLSDRVTFLGERDDVPDLLRAADVFVLPSLFEGLPLAVLEAMALGVPTVATCIGGTSEALGADHPWYAPPNDPAALAAAIGLALESDAGRQSVGTAGKTRFYTEFQASRMARQTADLYRRIALPNVTSIGKKKSMHKTRVGFIGCGGIAHRHLRVLESFEDVRLTAFADPDFGRAEEAARRFGAQAFETHAEMLEKAELDAVYICVPPFAHGAPEKDVLARRLPFFVEKPLSLDVALAQRIAGEIARKNIVTAVGYHWRYLDTVEEARRLLAGNPAQLLSGYWLDQTPPPQWWWRENRSGGQMVEQATHIIDLARCLAGEVTQVFGMAAHRGRDGFEGLDVATASTASLRFASGAIANIGATCLLRWGHRVGLHAFADGLAIELSDHEIMVDTGAGRPVRRAEGDPVWREDRDFVDAVRGGENRIRCPYADALETHRVALAIAESARTGMPVSLLSTLSEVANG